MKDRILTGWTFTRGLYAVLGSLVLIQSVVDQQWFGIVFGAYFASIGLFNFGCAAGNCSGDKCDGSTLHYQSEVNLKEIKQK